MKRLYSVIWIILCALVMRACVLEPVKVTDDSMMPTVGEGESVLVSKLSYGLRVPGSGVVLFSWQEPQKGDLVVSYSIGDPPLTVLRRVTSVAGDKVQIEGKEVELKANEFFLSAEQKDIALDSRQFGIISRRAIVGKAKYIWLPKAQTTSSNNGSKVESGNSFLKPLL